MNLGSNKLTKRFFSKYFIFKLMSFYNSNVQGEKKKKRVSSENKITKVYSSVEDHLLPIYLCTPELKFCVLELYFQF